MVDSQFQERLHGLYFICLGNTPAGHAHMMKQGPAIVVLCADHFQRDAHFVDQPREGGGLAM